MERCREQTVFEDDAPPNRHCLLFKPEYDGSFAYLEALPLAFVAFNSWDKSWCGSSGWTFGLEEGERLFPRCGFVIFNDVWPCLSRRGPSISAMLCIELGGTFMEDIEDGSTNNIDGGSLGTLDV